ncbi:unnamed protein product [Hymenolepis diminuta]|nr:unnamed protein product [Hymenolepis diminuta]
MRNHRPDNPWAEDIIRARRGSLQYEVDVDGQTWVLHRSYLSTRDATKSSKPKMSLLDIILDIIGLPPPRDNGISEIQPMNQQHLRSERSRKMLDKWHIFVRKKLK